MSSGIFITTEKEEEKKPQIVITVKIKTRLNDQQVAPKTSRILAVRAFCLLKLQLANASFSGVRGANPRFCEALISPWTSQTR